MGFGLAPIKLYDVRGIQTTLLRTSSNLLGVLDWKRTSWKLANPPLKTSHVLLFLRQTEPGVRQFVDVGQVATCDSASQKPQKLGHHRSSTGRRWERPYGRPQSAWRVGRDLER